MNYKKIRANPHQFITLTSLTVEEFDMLLPVFKRHWIKYTKYHTLEGKKRKLPNLRPSKRTKTLPTVAEKLFFLLSYLKNYPLQEFQAASFDISQGKVSQWVRVLHPLLQESLKELGALPERSGEALASVLAKYDGEAFNMDAAERAVERSKDNYTQQDHYSGKQKDHTVKNNLICRDNQQIVYLSETYEGGRRAGVCMIRRSPTKRPVCLLMRADSVWT
ncbi:MAG: transposase family protein [Tunicatimonas sp.]